MPELRKDPVTGRWVTISALRAARPSDFAGPKLPETERGKTCPFDTGHESMTPPEVFAMRPPGSAANGPGWSLRVVSNRFPALTIEGSLQRSGDGIYDRMSGIGNIRNQQAGAAGGKIGVIPGYGHIESIVENIR